MANTLSGSAIAIVKVAPERDKADLYCGPSRGDDLTMPGPLEMLELIEGRRTAGQEARDLLVADVAQETKALPSLPPWRFWCASAPGAAEG